VTVVNPGGKKFRIIIKADRISTFLPAESGWWPPILVLVTPPDVIFKNNVIQRYSTFDKSSGSYLLSRSFCSLVITYSLATSCNVKPGIFLPANRLIMLQFNGLLMKRDINYRVIYLFDGFWDKKYLPTDKKYPFIYLYSE